MFQINAISGRALLLKKETVCLTFDDGPGHSEPNETGPKTLLLAEYLAEEKVPATFFVVGKHAEQFPETIKRLHELGHLIGNHTWNHPNLTAETVTQKGEDVIGELTRTEALLPAPKNGMPIFFRPPYGTWSEQISRKLNSDPHLQSSHLGPVMWDVDGKDWKRWRERSSPETCAEDYLNRINGHQTGVIVLQHDHSANDPAMASRNRTYEMTKLLVPKLKQQGYKFARLDELAEIKILIERHRSAKEEPH